MSIKNIRQGKMPCLITLFYKLIIEKIQNNHRREAYSDNALSYSE